MNVLGVLAGRDLAPGALEAWLAWADRVVAADGGADLCRAAGREPDAIVGDLDSIADPSGLTPDEDQDSSDADKLLARLASEGRAEATLIGVEGDRLDHVLATLYSVAKRKDVRCHVVLRTGSCRVLLGYVHERLKTQGRLSLLPLGKCRVFLDGVRWPLHNQTLSSMGPISLSNLALPGGDGFVEVVVYRGVAALFLESGGLPPSSDRVPRVQGMTVPHSP